MLSHPGAYIRENVIPKGMSVKDAAARLGVGRPALSNLLNGKSSLSPDMAVRLEKAFGADRKDLLDQQAAFDRHCRIRGERGVAVRAYVPGFLAIKAAQIESWAGASLAARQLLPVLLRKLVHSTGLELRNVDFPGYDNAERKGPDGVVEAGAATAWIPEGRSYWEFGTNQNPATKAEADYAARLGSVAALERAASTFVFVTPRNWPGKAGWAKGKNAAGDWRAVRALDASDLEQWLEESVAAPIWLVEQIGITVEGFETLEEYWRRWAKASDPEIVPAIFESSVAAYRKKVIDWLEQPSDRPFIVAADSRGEAIAFLACLFQDPEVPTRSRDLAAVFESPQALRKLAAASVPFVPIVCTHEAERELATLYRRVHCIVVRPRNAINSEPDVDLAPLGHDIFEKALAAMGIEGGKAEMLARESGCSPTILRRRLSKIEAIRTPQWAGDAEAAKRLVPMAFLGAWHTKSSADREAVSFIADRPYQEVEDDVVRLLQSDDCPVWSVGQYRGVASKVDALFAISWVVTERDLEDFIFLAEHVLSEVDPALDLPEDQKWAAGLYGKVRDHSAALRDGISETLVILAVNGNSLFLDRLGIDVGGRVSLLVQRLLTPLTLNKLLSHDNDLPHYAEAAPDGFLGLIEDDLRRPEPVVLGLLRPADGGVFSGCPRSSLLWALECLAWAHLGRVSAVLARLSRTVIDDNWANKPIASLESIFRSWMPQTAAPLSERIRALELLARRFPDVGWKICVEQFATGSQIGHYNYRPRWRSDASGAGQPVTVGEMRAFARKALDLALAWPAHDEETLGDLVERLQCLPEDDQAAVWDLVDRWVDGGAGDPAKARLRERIRRYAFTRRGRRRGVKGVTKDRARAAYAKLESADPVIRHGWLFANHWVEVSADEIEDENQDFEGRGERIHRLRVAAMEEVWTDRGLPGVAEMLSLGWAPYVAGRYLGLVVAGWVEQTEFLRRCLSIGGDLERMADGCLQGFICSIEGSRRNAVLGAAAEATGADDVARLLRCAPFGEGTWRLLDQYGEGVRDKYWKEVYPEWNRHSGAELTELVDCLLGVGRPLAAFHAAQMDWPRVETSRLKRLLLAVGTTHEGGENYGLDAYHVSCAFEALSGRTGVSPDEMARLEFLFLGALDRTKHGIPNLECQIAESPAVFVQAVVFAYKRKDDGQDPPEWQIEDPERRTAVATATYRLLSRLRRIPGTARDGKVDADGLLAWVSEVRLRCAEHGRGEIADQLIGQLLSQAPAEDDGTWPCLAVCEAMETVAARRMGSGFSIGVFNSRGVHYRGEGGAQERDLAAKYRGWSKRLAYEYPFVSGILEGIAADYDHEGERQDAEDKIRKRLRE